MAAFILHKINVDRQINNYTLKPTRTPPPFFFLSPKHIFPSPIFLTEPSYKPYLQDPEALSLFFFPLFL